MSDTRYLYGPVPSRRLGLSLGISPIPDNTCSHSCIYCQLGRTRHLTVEREEFYPLADMVREIDAFFSHPTSFDVVTIVGEGEPTLYARMGDLIDAVKRRTDRPVAVITNGSLLHREDVARELMKADIVLPSVDAVDETAYRRINRPVRSLTSELVLGGIRSFTESFEGQVWLESMLLKEINDSDQALYRLRDYLDTVPYEKLYINTPVRPPAEEYVEQPTAERIRRAEEILGGVAIDHLVSEGFVSEIEDDLQAIKSIILRHPMNQHEVRSFLESRHPEDADAVMEALQNDPEVKAVPYRGYLTFRMN